MSSVVLACLSTLLAVWLVPVPAAVADPVPHPSASDHLTLTGYDFVSDLAAAVVARRSDNNLRLDLVAGEPLVDGTLVVTLPRKDWPDELHPAAQLYEGSADLPGSVVVRPVAPLFDLTDSDCRGTGDQPITVLVDNTPTKHLVTVQHLSCAMGQHISLRVVEIRAPRDVGSHAVGVDLSDGSGRRGPRSLQVRVSTPPTARLTVDVPKRVISYQPTPVVVTVLRPDGRVDRRATGWVRLTGPAENDCIFESGATVSFELSAADAGRKVVDISLQDLSARRIVALSSSHRARTGHSRAFRVSGDEHGLACPISYH